jgi:hypothetical protein
VEALKKKFFGTSQGWRSDFSPQQCITIQRGKPERCSCASCCGRECPRSVPRSLSAFDGEADYLTRLAFREDFDWPAANFAVGRETLAGDTRVEDDIEFLPTKRASNGG